MTAPRDKAVAYVAYNSLPFHSGGYATRSHGLISGLRDLGFDARIVTRLGYPGILDDLHDVTVEPLEEVVGVPYYRLPQPLPTRLRINKLVYLQASIISTLNVLREHRPVIVHGASNFVTGLTAVHVARALGAKSVYEVRGLWEITALSRNPDYASTLHFAQAVRLETEACLGADHVITITGGLKEELVRRGVPAAKISIVPNGVDTSRFQPRQRDMALGRRLGLAEDSVVIGYVGSIVDYEGLDDLLRAMRCLLEEGVSNLRLLVVGDGAAYRDCVTLSNNQRNDLRP